jgi:hypothetical protein
VDLFRWGHSEGSLGGTCSSVQKEEMTMRRSRKSTVKGFPQVLEGELPCGGGAGAPGNYLQSFMPK